jgi:hypothetical protein
MSYRTLSQTAPIRTDVVLPAREKTTGPVTRFFQVAVLLALIPVAIFYLIPRVYNLVATPSRLDKAVTYASLSNQRLMKVAEEEKTVTLPAFTALDQMNAAVTRVECIDAHSAQQLAKLIGQISGDLHAILSSADANVRGLVSSLTALGAQLNALNAPSSDAAGATTADRATLAAILANARATAAQVHEARREADTSSHHVSGK